MRLLATFAARPSLRRPLPHLLIGMGLVACLNVAYAAPGDLDPTFGQQGIVTEGPGGGSGDIALQSDGGIVAAGISGVVGSEEEAFEIYFYSPLGEVRKTVTVSFDEFWVYNFSFPVAVQSDGKIIVAGTLFKNTFTEYPEGTIRDVGFALLRLLPDGTLDSSFGESGKIFHNLSHQRTEIVTDMVLQPDGKIVVSGYASVANGSYVVAARFNGDGSLDTTFGGSGIFYSSPPSSFDDVYERSYDVELQQDGKLLLSGSRSIHSVHSDDPYYEALMIRLAPNGHYDSSFGTAGRVTLPYIIHNASAIAVQPDGKIIVAGSSIQPDNRNYSDFALLRYQSNGKLDASFGTNGIVTFDSGSRTWDTPYDIALQEYGRILVSGSVFPADDAVFPLPAPVFRLDPDGSLDRSFGNNGRVENPENRLGRSLRKIVLQSDGKILVAGGIMARLEGGLGPDAIIAHEQSATTAEDSQLNVTLAAEGPEGRSLAYTIVTRPSHGALGPVEGNRVIYTPTEHYSGPDSFTFKASDGTRNSNIATVSITVSPVNDPPIAQNGSAVTFRDRIVTVTLSAGDIEGDPLTYTIVAAPEHGVLTGTAPNLLYTPDQGYTGSDSFTFTANDGTAESTPATVSLNVLMPFLTLGSATAGPGEETFLPIHLTEAASNVTGIELILQAVGPDGAPAPTPTFFTAPATDGWTVVQNPSTPWRIVLIGADPLAGPAEVLRLRLASSPQTPDGTAYRIEAALARLTDSRGQDTDVTGQTAPGSLLVQPCETRVKGDVNGDGAVDIRDAVSVLRVIVEVDAFANECAFVAADVNCTGSISVGDAVLILRNIVFDEPFPCP